MKFSLSKISTVIRRHPVNQAYIFGSVARGKTGPLSDLDIAVLFNENVDHDQAEKDLLIDLSRSLGINTIDVVNLSKASALLAHRAVLLGRPLLKHNPHEAAVLKTSILHRYEDERFFRTIKQRSFV